jgi:2,3-bisphosphoglycerate-independent phosphoglycerate mutase
MRYAILIPDGAADRPHPDLGGKTPFEVAAIPSFHAIAREGRFGLARTVPSGMKPGSDTANLAVLGYDPAECYTGRAPLEAAALGVALAPGEAVFRANTVTIEDGRMKDYSADHIATAEAREIVQALDRRLGMPGVKLHPGVSYRHLAVLAGMVETIPDRPGPHEIPDRIVREHDPTGKGAERLLAIEARTRELLPGIDANRKRLAAGKLPVTQLWLWGGGVPPTLVPYRERFGLEGGLISAVDLLKGIALLAGLEPIAVPGATGYYDTNFAGKGRAALDCLRRKPFVAVHVEASDEAGHNGHAAEKAKALENIDRHILAPLLDEARRAKDLRILCLPDHPTPLALRNHTADPVPFALWGPGVAANGAQAFTEAEAARVGGAVLAAQDLLPLLLGSSRS